MALSQEIKSIPIVFKSIGLAFLTISIVYITYPIADKILSLFPTGMMKLAAILSYWLIILFVTWFLFWANVFEKGVKTPKGGN